MVAQTHRPLNYKLGLEWTWVFSHPSQAPSWDSCWWPAASSLGAEVLCSWKQVGDLCQCCTGTWMREQWELCLLWLGLEHQSSNKAAATQFSFFEAGNHGETGCIKWRCMWSAASKRAHGGCRRGRCGAVPVLPGFSWEKQEQKPSSFSWEWQARADPAYPNSWGSPLAPPRLGRPAGAGPGGRRRCWTRGLAAGLAPRSACCSPAGGAAASGPGGGGRDSARGRRLTRPAVARGPGARRARQPGADSAAISPGLRRCRSEGGERRRRRRRREGRGRRSSRSALRLRAANTHTSPAAAAALLPDSGERERVEAKKSQTRERRQKTAGRGKEVREEGNVERGIRTPPPRGETTSHVARDRGGSWRSGTVREALTSKLLNPGRAAGRGHSSNHWSEPLFPAPHHLTPGWFNALLQALPSFFLGLTSEDVPPERPGGEDKGLGRRKEKFCGGCVQRRRWAGSAAVAGEAEAAGTFSAGSPWCWGSCCPPAGRASTPTTGLCG